MWIVSQNIFNISKNPKHDGYERGLASVVYKFFNKNTSVETNEIEIVSNEKLAEELNKLIIKTFKRGKVYSSFKDNIWGADLVDMQLISKFNKGF